MNDGPYLVTYNDGHRRADMLRTSISGAQHICGTTPDWLIERGCTLTPLAPAVPEPTLAAIRELCNCVDVLAAAPCPMPEFAGAYLDDVATVRAWLERQRKEDA